jgi:hypothetical protein
MLKFHLSRTSFVEILAITITALCKFPVSNQSVQKSPLLHLSNFLFLVELKEMLFNWPNEEEEEKIKS